MTLPRLPGPFPASASLAILMSAALAVAAGPNLARNRPCKASSVEGQLLPGKAVDGPKSQASRWGSNYQTDRNKDSAWIFVDLGSPQTVDSMAIYWEHSGARPFAVQAWNSEVDTPSHTDEGWETLLRDSTLVYQAPPVDMCLSFHRLKPTVTRYVRIRCYKRMFQFGFSIMELEVYGPGPTAWAGAADGSGSGPAGWDGSRLAGSLNYGYSLDGRRHGDRHSASPWIPRVLRAAAR